MAKKIALISFDNWNYDSKIIEALAQRGVTAYHINLGKFKHSSVYTRILNAFSKVVFKKNLKHIKRQKFILSELDREGFFEQILVINPELIDLEYHLKIKKYTSKYIAYLYDSIARCNVEHLLNNIFETIFSFDQNDCLKYGFLKTNNYIYIDNKSKIEVDNKTIITISSFDSRLSKYNEWAYQLEKENRDFKFIFVGKNSWYKRIKYNLKAYVKNQKSIHSSIITTNRRMSLKEVEQAYREHFAVIDLVQYNQSGLSFRVFETMALQKKIITDNVTIKNEPFYNPNNIFVFDKGVCTIPDSFLEIPYEPLNKDIYNSYTIDAWVAKIFQL